MEFNSLQFVYFFFTSTVLYYLAPAKYRWILVLVASCYFYISFIPIYLLVLGFMILVDYSAAIMIEGLKNKKKKLALICSLISNVGILLIFKYYNFIGSNLSYLFDLLNVSFILPDFHVLLPIGLSFHTFQSMGYTIDVYRGKQNAERNLGIYALYVIFYPQVIAGPIERASNLIHQFREEHPIDYNNIASGLKLMAWGFFKKVVIADRLSIGVNFVYGNPREFHGFPLLLATFFFAIQIYCDFSGYCDIAIGAARVLRINLMKNFNNPYFSRSVSEFWSRWHISLSTWFRDYVYIPLGGNKGSLSKVCFNLFLTFLISGLWHGGNWTYLAWGAVNGTYLVIENLLTYISPVAGEITSSRLVSKLVELIKISFTFCLICFSWVFFRAETMADALYIIENFFTNFSDSLVLYGTHKMGIDKFNYVVLIYGITILLSVDFLRERYELERLVRQQPFLVRGSLYTVLLLSIFLFGAFDSVQEFIYFQF